MTLNINPINHSLNFGHISLKKPPGAHQTVYATGENKLKKDTPIYVTGEHARCVSGSCIAQAMPHVQANLIEDGYWHSNKFRKN